MPIAEIYPWGNEEFLEYAKNVRDAMDSIFFEEAYINSSHFKGSERETELLLRCFNTEKDHVYAAKFIEKVWKRNKKYCP